MGAQSVRLHEAELLRGTILNSLFAAVYAVAILAILYHHAQILIIHSKTLVSFSISLSLLLSDLILAFMWATEQSFRYRPIRRKEYPENLEKMLKPSDYPAIDIFICTADPYKEPPMNVVNTALSVLAYDYPAEKISVYVSDDGGSASTLFAFMEAAKFASHWLPFCGENNIMERSPEAYFATSSNDSSAGDEIKMMYERMKVRIEHVVETGRVDEDYINNDQEHQLFEKLSHGFTPQDHPTVIQVLLESSKDKDITGNSMPNLVYISRQKSKTSPHHFKAGALNVLVRVSGIMTNAPIILTLDCDMNSNDPRTPLRALCYLSDPTIQSDMAFVQFPQIFRGLNKNDIYASEMKGLYKTNARGLDGLHGPNYLGTNSFLQRRAFFGNPSNFISPEIPQLHPDHVVDQPINSPTILSLAHNVACCNYEDQTFWGSKIGFRYGSLSEDYYTGYRLHCEGWRSSFCYPTRPAFYGDAPITLIDMLNQSKRWTIGLSQVGFSKYCPAIYGVRYLGLMGLAYAHYAFCATWSIPLLVYAFLPQLALLRGVPIFPKVSEPWFLLYSFIVLGAYGQNCLGAISTGGTLQKWWNEQRIWMIRGLSSFFFGPIELLLRSIGKSIVGFNVTNKVIHDEQSKRYDQQIFEFGDSCPMFVPISVAAIVNLFALFRGLFWILFSGGDMESLFTQLFLTGFIVVNCWPIYEAMVLRSDKGKLPAKITVVATFLALALYVGASLAF